MSKERKYDANLIVTVKLAVNTEVEGEEDIAGAVVAAERKARAFIGEALEGEKESWPLSDADISEVLVTNIGLKLKE